MTRDEIIAKWKGKPSKPTKAPDSPSEERTQGGVAICTREEIEAWEAEGKAAFIREMREQLNRKPDA